MANTQTSVPVFTAGQVLTAQQQTEINTGIPVFATTVTRDAAFGGSGEKALAEGQFAYIEATNTTQYYDGAAWQAVGGASGLTLVSATTIGTTVSSVTVSSAFSATYDNYLITVSGGSGSTDFNLDMTLGSTATGYYLNFSYQPISSSTVTNGNSSNAGSFASVGEGSSNVLSAFIYLQNPFASKVTLISAEQIPTKTTQYSSRCLGFLDNTTSYTAFTLTTNAGTMTGGTVRVYGYQNS